MTADEYDSYFNLSITTMKKLINHLKKLATSDRQIVLNLLEQHNICHTKQITASYIDDRHWCID